jgi:hypothetical protein
MGDREMVSAVREALGGQAAIVAGVELPEHIVRFADERDRAVNRQSGRVEHTDVQFAGTALNELS